MTVQKKKVALFGGAFDPPHNGHLAVATGLAKGGKVDEVWIVPSGNRVDKNYYTSDEHRKRLIELAFPGFQICWVEWEEDPPLGSWELIKLLEKRSPELEFYLAIGNELVKDLPKWRHAEELQRDIKFIVHKRNAEVDISSSKIREMIKARKSLSDFVAPQIVNYIFINKLYLR